MSLRRKVNTHEKEQNSHGEYKGLQLMKSASRSVNVLKCKCICMFNMFIENMNTFATIIESGVYCFIINQWRQPQVVRNGE